jgi:glycosyltransferase involved in cell wall biosynthesis
MANYENFNGIPTFIRPKKPSDMYGKTGGGAHIFFEMLENDPDFQIIPVSDENLTHLKTTVHTHIEAQGPIFMKVPKPHYIGHPANELGKHILRKPRSGGKTADMWNDVFTTKFRGIKDFLWTLHYLALANKHGVLHVVTIPEIARELENFGVPPERILITPNEIRPEFLSSNLTSDPLKRTIYFDGATKEDLVVASHGRIAPTKKLEWLLELVHYLEQKLNTDKITNHGNIILTIIGNYQASTYGMNLYDQAKQLGLLEKNRRVRIFMPGPIPNADLPQVLAQADAFIALHHDAPQIPGWHMNVSEGFASGLPLFTRSYDGIPLQHPGNYYYGSFYDFGDHPTPEIFKSISIELHKLLQQPLYQRYSTRYQIREFAQKIFSLGSTIQTIKNALI